MAATGQGYSFTAAQWKELERQAMIYKYMMASVPVPSHLLFPAADPITPPPSLLGSNVGSSAYNLRYGNRDVEVGRCKRTDGKKWRCSRDVAPHQKYCDRHIHRGRPRSRKPVELHSSPSSLHNFNHHHHHHQKKSRLHPSPLHHPNPTPQAQSINISSPQFPGTSTTQQANYKHPLLLEPSGGQNIFDSSADYKESNRIFGWAMDGEIVATNGVEQQRLHLVENKREGLDPTQDSIYGTDASALQLGYGEEEPLNLFSYSTTEFASPVNIPIHNHSDECHLFLNSDFISSQQPQIDQHCCASEALFDACVNEDVKKINSRGTTNLSSSSFMLSLTMLAGNAPDEGMELVTDSHQQDCPASWLLPFTSGGPLAEVMQPKSVAHGSMLASWHSSNGGQHGILK